jgi:4-hydroxy-tetrahydrodipicolinate synthase
MKNDYSGIWTALITPFENQKIDYESLKNLISFQEEAGIKGLVINGTTAESPTLETEEIQKIYEFVRKNFSGSVVLGTGSNCTHKTIKMTKLAKKWEADGALVVTPYYNKPTQVGIIAHFKAIAKEVDIPVILYNVPSRTITSMEVSTVKTLSEISNIVGIKEAQGNMDYSKKVFESVDSGFQILSGDDVTCFDQNLLGGVGVISVISHLIPEKYVSFDQSSQKKDESYKIEFNKYKNLLKELYNVSNPIPVKMALKKMGLIKSAELRLPLTELDLENSNKLENTLKSLQLI